MGDRREEELLGGLLEGAAPLAIERRPRWRFGVMLELELWVATGVRVEGPDGGGDCVAEAFRAALGPRFWRAVEPPFCCAAVSLDRAYFTLNDEDTA